MRLVIPTRLLAFLLGFTALCASAKTSKEQTEKYQQQLNSLLTGEKQAFRQNHGQYANDILFVSEGTNASARFYSDKVMFSLIRNQKLTGNPEDPFEMTASYLNWSLSFEGAASAGLLPEERISRNINYFGPNAKKAVELQEYRELTYRQIYPQTDLKFYSADNGALKYDFILNPGADVNAIRMNYAGINAIHLMSNGSMQLQTDWGVFVEDAPYSYQIINGKQQEVSVRYIQTSDSEIGFEIVGAYDATQPLIIDPIYVDWSTYFYGEPVGTSWSGWNYVLDIDIDDEDFVYITGMTTGQTFVSQLGGYDTTYGSGSTTTYYYDAFVCKITPDGDSLRYFTFIGGTNWEYAMNISVNSSHHAVISGLTYGAGYPTTSGAYDETGRSCSGGYCYQGFVTKFNETGNSLIYSTYLSGRSYTTTWAIDWIRGMQLADNGNVYLVGNTMAEDFPTTTGCFQSQYGGSSTGTGYYWYNSGDGFLTCLKADGSALVFSTYIGGSKNDVAHDLYVAPGGEIYVVGSTSSGNFPTTPGSTVFNKYIKGNTDGFVVKFKSNGNAMDFGKLMGGTGDESFEGIYANESGEPYIVGNSNSSNFPVSSTAFQKSNAGGYDLVVVKMISSGTNFRYSTYLGGSADDAYSPYNWWFDNMSITANVKEEAIISATSKSANFPVTSDALQSSNNGSSYYGKLTITKLSYTGSNLMYGTYFGGSGGEYPGGIRAKRVGCVTYILFAGNSYSGDFPTTKGVYKENKSSTGSWWSGFVTKFRDTLFTESIALSLDDTLVECDNVFEILDAKNQGADFLWSDGWKDRYNIVKDSGTIWVQATYGCDTVRDTITIELEHSPKVPVFGNDTTYCDNFPTLTLDAKNDTIYRSYIWDNGATTQTRSVTAPGKYWVDISTPNCGTKTDTINFKLLTTPIVDLGGDQIGCDSVHVTLDAENAGNEATYRWSNGDSVQTTLVRDTGTYYAVVTNFCGSDSDAVSLDKYTFPVAVLPQDSVFCDNIIYAMQAGQGENGESYEWVRLSDGTKVSDGTVFIAYGPQDIRMTVTNKCGADSDTVSIGLIETPKEGLNDSLYFCDVITGSVKIGKSDNEETYAWSSGQTTNSINLSSPGVLTGVTSNKCGSDSSVFHVFLNYKPTIKLPNDSTYCGSMNVKLDATDSDPEMTYLWQDGSNAPVYQATSAGTYSVTIENRCGLATDAVVYKLLQKPAFEFGAERVFCGAVTPFELVAGRADNEEVYSWNDGSGLDRITISSAGKYWVDVTNYCGSDNDTLDVRVSAYPIVNLGIDTILCGNFSLMLDAGNPGMSYSWEPTGEITQTIQATEQTIYRVTVTNADGCEGTDEFEIGSGCISYQFIPSSFTPNGDGLNEVFKPTLVNFENYELEIFNRWGERLFGTHDVNVGWDGTYNGNPVPEGVYLYRMRFIATENGEFQNVNGLLHVVR
ncbi:MAG: gliding motility-associated C-terminal domain-containing protein [Flavobacteriales bacterium]|nr:gliding motility-associated C-terminal domain-containing protein [Flavobacteriales bacterium]